MRVEKELSVVDGVCTFCPLGKATIVEGVELVSGAITYCRVRNITKLLVDLRELFGYPVPSLADRYWMVQDWAEAARGALIVAVVALPEYIDPNKFGVKAAADAGLKGDVFTSVADASAWLLANEPTVGFESTRALASGRSGSS